jgi:predicted NAD/FAD-dependent oxidoreductase
VVRADAVVLAVPPPVADMLLPAGAVDYPAPFAELGASPIVNIHLVYDRRVLDRQMLAVVGSPIQWIFDRTASSGLAESRPGAQYLALSQSAAQEWVDVPAAELTQMFDAHMRQVLPAAREAELVEAFVTRERTATFRQAPGSLALRPGAATALPGLALAGAWTDTGWPATMEGAVRSGLVAVRTALAGLSRHSGMPAERRPAGGADTGHTAVATDLVDTVPAGTQAISTRSVASRTDRDPASRVAWDPASGGQPTASEATS